VARRTPLSAGLSQRDLCCLAWSNRSRLDPKGAVEGPPGDAHEW
jgi:hypothetical protein